MQKYSHVQVIFSLIPDDLKRKRWKCVSTVTIEDSTRKLKWLVDNLRIQRSPSLRPWVRCDNQLRGLSWFVHPPENWLTRLNIQTTAKLQLKGHLFTRVTIWILHFLSPCVRFNSYTSSWCSKRSGALPFLPEKTCFCKYTAAMSTAWSNIWLLESCR